MHLEADQGLDVELRLAVIAEIFRSDERGGGNGGGGEGGGEGGGGGDEGGCEGGDGGDQGEGGGDGGCSRGTAHQVGRSRANWQSTVWLVRLIKDYNGDEGDKSVEDAWWREVGALSMGIKYEW
jgi:hypothetical protein